MPKEIRFSKLVERSGKPATATLWTRPDENPALLKALKENRVLTVSSHPGAGKRDFGQIGFHPQRSAVYLVFPKALPQTDIRVVGINYDLIEEPVPEFPAKFPMKSKPRARQTRAGPPEKQFRIIIERTAIVDSVSVVKAQNERQARAKAMLAIRDAPFELDGAEIESRVKGAEVIDEHAKR